MIFFALLLNSLLLGIAIFNFATIRRPKSEIKSGRSVLVLLPVRNEIENIERVLSELDLQIGIADYKVLVINDNSDDGTAEKAQQFASHRISVINAPSPAAGWIGKVSALQYGYHSIFPALSDAVMPDVVISIDADVHFERDALVRAVATLEDANLDFLSPYPRQIAITWAERLTQPLLQWSWMSTVFLRGAEKFPMKSTVICNGQFLVMNAKSLVKINGFESVAHKVLDDIELGRSFVAAGFKGAVTDGSEIASTRMYSNFDQLRRGYGKSLHLAFGNFFGSIVATLFMVFTAIYPALIALSGNLIAIAALVAIIGTRVVSAAASGTRVRDALLHPFSALLFLYLLYFSWRNRRIAEWKGRRL